MYSTWMQLERKYYWGIQKDVRVTNLNLTRKQLFGLVMWRVMRRNVWEDIANWQIKKLSCSTRVSAPCLGDHQFKKEELETVGEFSKFCSHIVLKCLHVDRIVRLDMLWSVNKFCTICHAMDQSLWPTLGLFDLLHIHYTSDHRHYCHVGNTAQDCSKTQILLETLKILNTFRTEFCVSSEVEHLFLWVGNKLQSLTVQRNLKLFLCTLVFAWTVSLLSILGIWLLKCCILPKTCQFGETRGEKKPEAKTSTPRRRNTSTELMLNYSMCITLSQTQNFLTSKPCFTFAMTMKQ